MKNFMLRCDLQKERRVKVFDPLPKPYLCSHPKWLEGQIVFPGRNHIRLNHKELSIKDQNMPEHAL